MSGVVGENLVKNRVWKATDFVSISHVPGDTFSLLPHTILRTGKEKLPSQSSQTEVDDLQSLDDGSDRKRQRLRSRRHAEKMSSSLFQRDEGSKTKAHRERSFLAMQQFYSYAVSASTNYYYKIHSITFYLVIRRILSGCRSKVF